jgi:hypothetical protein
VLLRGDRRFADFECWFGSRLTKIDDAAQQRTLRGASGVPVEPSTEAWRADEPPNETCHLHDLQVRSPASRVGIRDVDLGRVWRRDGWEAAVGVHGSPDSGRDVAELS